MYQDDLTDLAPSVGPYTLRYPMDSERFVFLKRSIYSFGRAMFPDEWTGAEASVVAIGYVPPTDGEQAAQLRALKVRRKIVEFCEAGILKAVLRPRAGGEFSDVLPPALWRLEAYHARFDTFLLHPGHPFAPYCKCDERQWIFFDRTSHDAALDKLLPLTVTRSDQAHTPYISENMQLLFDIITKLGVTADNQPKSEEAIAMAKQLWRGQGALSQRTAEAIDSVLRLRATHVGRGRHLPRT
jgi:hypothetical protein